MLVLRAIRVLLLALLLVAGLAVLEPWIEKGLYAARLAAMAAPESLPVPVAGVPPRRVQDSWHAPRDGGRRRHEGVDIFAPRGTPVLSATEGIVLRVVDRGLGGKAVWVLGPGGQRHYYAHLDAFATIRSGSRVQAGYLLGYVGNTGNARHTPPHLHYGIYATGGAINPYPLLRAGAG